MIHVEIIKDFKATIIKIFQEVNENTHFSWNIIDLQYYI